MLSSSISSVTLEENNETDFMELSSVWWTIIAVSRPLLKFVLLGTVLWCCVLIVHADSRLLFVRSERTIGKLIYYNRLGPTLDVVENSSIRIPWVPSVFLSGIWKVAAVATAHLFM